MTRVNDLFIVGGGINGAGIARDAAGRGLKVVLCEKHDLASGTSSNSTKLIHGGLRYLEHYEFRLVRESLIERERLLRAAPHIIWPMRFILPHRKGLRPAFILRLGLFLYDHIGGRKLLAPTKTLRLNKDPAGLPLKPDFTQGFEYSDCWVDDARLVILNAIDAERLGARILTRSTFKSARRQANGLWSIIVQTENDQTQNYHARTLINASGPWVSQILRDTHYDKNRQVKHLKLVKGSHLIVKRMFAHDQAYTLQNADGRVIFAIPYERDFTLIGTTDVNYDSDPDHVVTSADEVDYLCRLINEYFQSPVSKHEIVHTYSGVRPLYDDGSVSASTVTRDYAFDLSPAENGAPLLSIYGGKLTTYRKLAEHVMGMLKPRLGFATNEWTVSAPLPGGDMPNADFVKFRQSYLQRYRWMPISVLNRLLSAYGTRIDLVLNDAQSLDELGKDFGYGLYEAELDYLSRHEHARTADDVLWRRSKLGLHIKDTEQIDAWLQNHVIT